MLIENSFGLLKGRFRQLMKTEFWGTEFLDLSNLEAVRAFARSIHEKENKVDILINNAGIFCMNKQKTIDHFDSVMQVNHLGPLLLTNLKTKFWGVEKTSKFVLCCSIVHNLCIDNGDLIDEIVDNQAPPDVPLYTEELDILRKQLGEIKRNNIARELTE
nr:unnamed protein product [Callosobruchus analis]